MILFYQNLITKLVINTSMLTLLIMMPMVIGATEMFGPRQVGDGIFTTYQLTPDGQQVVYSADEALFIANIDGGNATQIAEVEAGGIISNIKISANSQRIVFLAVETNLIFNTEVNFISSLHGVSSDGDNFFTYVESPFEQPFIDVGEFEITADSRRVVYLFNNGGRQALFSQSLDGGDEFAYNRNPANSLDIREAHSFELSPDGSTVVFIANNISNLSEVRLYSAPSSGAERTQLNDESQSPVSTSTQFSISPDNNFVLFPGGRVPLVGGTQIPLFDGISGRVSNITISPDSDHVIFLSNDDLFRISSTGGSPFKLSTGITDIGQVIGDYIISPDSQRVVFRVREDAADLSAGFDLYTVPLMGGATTRLNAPLSATRSVESFLVSPDSSYVAYFADHEGSPPSNFFSVPIMGGSPVQLSPRILAFRNAPPTFDISADSRRIIYFGDQRGGGTELFSVLQDGSQRTLLSNNVTQFLANSTSTRVVLARPRLVSVGIDGVSESDISCVVIRSKAATVIPICL